MKNVLVAACRERKKGSERRRELYSTQLQAQIDNSLMLGWSPRDIIALTDFPFKYRNVQATCIEFPPYATKNCKTFAALTLFEDLNLIEQGSFIWLHDLDAWQIRPFTDLEKRGLHSINWVAYREDLKPIGKKQAIVNGGSIFYKNSKATLRFLRRLVNIIASEKVAVEEPAMTDVIIEESSKKYIRYLPISYNFTARADTIQRRAKKSIDYSQIYILHNLEAYSDELKRRTMTPELVKLVEKYGECLYE